MSTVAILMARLGVDTAPFKTGLRSAVSDVSAFRSGLLNVPALGSVLTGAGLGLAIRDIAETAKHVQDLSDRFGVSTTVIQQWGHAAELNGSSLESLTMAFNKLDVARSKGLAGDDSMLKHFTSLGVTFRDLQTLSPDELMKKIGSGALEASDRVAVLGRGSGDLKVTLKGVADGTISFGAAISAIDIKKLAEADDLFIKMAQNAKVAAASWVAAPILRGWESLQKDGEFLLKLNNQLGNAIVQTATGKWSQAGKTWAEAWKTAFREGVLGVKATEPPAPEKKPGAGTGDDEEGGTKGKVGEKVREALAAADIVRLQLAGELQLAEALKTQLDFEKRINAARDEGLEGLAKALEMERDLTLQKQSQDAARKRLENVQLSLGELAKEGRTSRGFSSDQPYGYGAGTQAREALKELELARKATLAENLPDALQHRARAEDIKGGISTLKESEKDPLGLYRAALDSSVRLQNIENNTAKQFSLHY